MTIADSITDNQVALTWAKSNLRSLRGQRDHTQRLADECESYVNACLKEIAALEDRAEELRRAERDW